MLVQVDIEIQLGFQFPIKFLSLNEFQRPFLSLVLLVGNHCKNLGVYVSIINTIVKIKDLIDLGEHPVRFCNHVK